MLNLIFWLMAYTSINNNAKTSNKDIITYFLKCFPDAPENINFHIGRSLKIIYGNDLKKLSNRPVYYNLELHQNPKKEIIIKDINQF